MNKASLLLLLNHARESSLPKSELDQLEELINSSFRQASDSEERLNHLKKVSGAGSWVRDIKTGIVTWDDQMYKIFGVEPGSIDLNLSYVQSRLVPEDVDRVTCIANQALLTGSEYACEFRLVLPDGSIRHILAQGKAYLDEPVRTCGFCLDITEQRLAEQAAKTVTQAHEDFVARLSHDLKNPLLGQDRMLELLEQNLRSLDGSHSRIISVLKQGTNEMLELVSSSLELYRQALKAPPVVAEQLDVIDFVSQCVDQFSPLAAARGVELRTLDGPGTLRVFADRMSLKRIVTNLLDNAVKFTPPDGVVDVSCELKDHHFVLRVKDSGPGIAREEQDTLFRRFSQTSTGRKFSAGTGLGLAFCRELAEAHGGTLTCESEAGSGSTFIVCLPLQPDAAHSN